ncbi:MAG: 4-hydroxy-tetrahydrodipicolinate synthase [Nitrospinae bacterium]|nr:4-hydroxy-tetrahydrodipicolinate synthase [Nitrospinota bacterium]
MIKGSIAAIVTPFKNNKPDKARFFDLVEWHVASGTDGIVPCGSTGEAATLDYDEHIEVISWGVQAAKGRIKVIGGTGSNSTAEAIGLSKKAVGVGVDALLLVSPYYNKPTQEGLYQHHMAIADAVAVPQILYNVPGRTSSNLLPETAARLSSHQRIIGIKEATGSVEQAIDVLALCQKGFNLYSGDDLINYPILAIGGAGSISVTANVWPEKMARMHDQFFAGNFGEALALHLEMRELSKAMFIETNPTPVKTALAMMGKIQEEVRLPLAPMSDANREKLAGVLRSYKLIN